jgi:hypothetical protein
MGDVRGVVAAQVIHEGGEAVERERRQAHLAIVHGRVTVCTLYWGVVSVGASSVRRAPVLDRQRVFFFFEHHRSFINQ